MADAGVERHAAGARLHAGRHQPLPLYVVQRPYFAGGAADEDAVRALPDEPVHQLLKAGRVDGHAIVVQRGDEGDDDPLQTRTFDQGECSW